MLREPNWETLNDINFVLYSRFVDSLNAALSAIELAESPAPTGHTAEWWHQRAKKMISTSLGMVMAWSWLVQYKNGMPLPRQAVRPFALQDALMWLGEQLKVPPQDVPQDPDHLGLNINQESFQEALIMINNVATGQGSAAQLDWNKKLDRVDFTVKFNHYRAVQPIDDLDGLYRSFSTHWRSQLVALELYLAESFLDLNNIGLKYQDDGRIGTFSFEIKRAVDGFVSQIDHLPATPPEPGISSQSLPDSQDALIASMPQQKSATSDALFEMPSKPLDETDPALDMTLGQSADDTSTWLVDGANLETPLQDGPALVSSWKPVMTYDEIDWDSLNFLNQQIYQRLSDPLMKVMGHLDLIRHDDGEEGQAEESLNAAQNHLETMMAYMRAWAVLTRWKQRGAAPIDYERVEPEELPTCLTKRIAPFTRFRQEHTRPIVIQKDTFCESIVILLIIAGAIGELTEVVMRDGGSARKPGVWLRIVFRPRADRPFRSKLDILDSLNRSSSGIYNMAAQFSVADDLLAVNNTRIALQVNNQNQSQAFAIWLPTEPLEPLQGHETVILPTTALPNNDAIDETKPPSRPR